MFATIAGGFLKDEGLQPKHSQHSRSITERHRYEDVVAAPPDAA